MRRLQALLLAAFIVPLMAVSSVSAWNPFSQIPCDGGSSTDSGSSAVCGDKKDKGNPLTGSDGLLMKIVNILAIVGGIAAVIVIILAGLRFVQAGGSAEDISGARRSMLYACVGIIVIVLARPIIAFVLSKL